MGRLRTYHLFGAQCFLVLALASLPSSLAFATSNWYQRCGSGLLVRSRRRSHRLALSHPLQPLSRWSATALFKTSNHEEQEIEGMPENAAIYSIIASIFAFVGQSTSLLVSATFFSVLAWYRSPFMVAFFLGAIANAILSKVLKRVLDQSRPTTNDTDLSDNGMPSSHAMSLGFIASVTASTFIGSPSFPVVALMLAAYTLVSLTYRVYAQYHTTAQVMAGLLGGCTNGWLFAQQGRFVLVEWLQTHAVFLFPPDATSFAVPWLIVPILLGTATVGSIERRIPKMVRFMRKET